MATIEKRNRGYSVRWYDLAGASRRRQCPSRAVAKELAAEIERLKAIGRDWTPDSSGAPPVVEAVSLYLADRSRVWRESTSGKVSISLSIFSEWLDRRSHRREAPVGDLSRETLAAYWSHLVGIRKVSRNTAANRVRHVEAFWAWCRDHEKWGDDVPRVRRLDTSTEPAPKTAPPTWAQMDAAIEQARGIRPQHGEQVSGGWWQLMTILRCTGLRKGQAMRLTWEDFDLPGATLTIRPELGKSKQERRGRVVPISAVLVRELAGWGMREGFVVPWPGARDPNRETSRVIWDRVSHYSPRQPLHCFRKGFVSGLAQLGVHEEVRKFLTGHSRGTHGDVYTGDMALMDAAREAVALVPPISASKVSAMRRAGE